jgi:predicted small lipoprotein YifL
MILERGPVMRRVFLAAAALLVVGTLSACGGSGGGKHNNPPTVTVSPATANVQEAATQQFTATVTNSTTTAVNWQVNGVAGGNSSVGTIDSTGLYTAPVIVPNPASITITAVLQADASVTGNAIATITAVQFNNSSLKGNYIFSLSGIDVNDFPFNAVGAVMADGFGNITGGEEDLNDVSSGYVQASSVTGTYNVGPDGRGTLNLNSSIGSFSYAIAIRALNNAGLNEIDNNVINATGNLEQQTAAGVTTPSGNYAFGFAGTGLNCGGAVNSIGVFNLGSGNVGGLQDLNCGGTITQSEALSGSYSAIDGLGRGTGLFSASTGSAAFVYYVISANRYRFMCPNAATFFLGSADLQTQSSFLASDFNGSYVVSTSANTPAGVSYTLIQLNASGGNVSSGYYDVNDTGMVGQASLSGAYSVASNGRIVGSFSGSGVPLPFSMYLISPSHAYYLDQRTTATGGGNVYAQGSSVTGNAAWAGSYATEQFGYFIVAGGIRAANSTSVSGQISADGAGTLAGTLDFNDPTNVFPGQVLQGTYKVGTVAPGRTIVAITTAEGTRNYVAYIVDQTRVLLLETDANLVSSGDAIRQF